MKYKSLHPFQTLSTFKDGVIIQDVTPQTADGGKRHISKLYVQGGEFITVRNYILSLVVCYFEKKKKKKKKKKTKKKTTF